MAVHLSGQHRKRRLDRFDETRIFKPLRDRRAVLCVKQFELDVGFRRHALQHLARQVLVLAGEDGVDRRAGPAHALRQQGGGQGAEVLVVRSDRLPAARWSTPHQGVHVAPDVEPRETGIARKAEQVEPRSVEKGPLGLCGASVTDGVPAVVKQDQGSWSDGHQGSGDLCDPSVNHPCCERFGGRTRSKQAGESDETTQTGKHSKRCAVAALTPLG